MKRLFLILATTFIITNKAMSQRDSTLLNGFNFEFLGPGLLYSANYERYIPIDKKNCITAGMGIETIILKFALVPSINFIHGEKNNLELGTSITMIDGDALWALRVGYRYQHKAKIFRVGFTPIMNFKIMGNRTFALPWLGISFGKAF